MKRNCWLIKTQLLATNVNIESCLAFLYKQCFCYFTVIISFSQRQDIKMIRHLMLCPVVLMCSAMAVVWLTTSSCVGVRMSRYWALGKFGEHERGVRVARGVAESNSSLMSAHECSPNFSSAQYLDIRTDEAWTNCFITLSKRSMQQLT